MNHKNNYLVAKEGLRNNPPNVLLVIITALITYLGIFVFLLIDLYAFLFQQTFFRAYKIPIVKRSEYLKIDRHKLAKLTFSQKLNCAYCGYANGIVAYFKATVNRMEEYSCAIKHQEETKATEHQKDFYNYKEYQ